MKEFDSLVEGSVCPPLAPSKKEKIAKISYFRQLFWIFAHQIRILQLDAPHENFSGATTGYAVDLSFLVILSFHLQVIN